MRHGEDLVPGHEFTGTVTAVGPAVTGFAPGERVAVGTLVDSCGVCAMCRAGQENFCYQGPTSTYGSPDRVDGTITKGGYSREYVLRERFAYHLPDGLDPAAAAPHDLSPLLRLLTLNGTLSVLGAPVETSVRLMELTFGRKNLSSSGTGGTRHTAELLSFCAERGITADIELLPSSQVEQALTRLEKGDVRYRFVLDLSDLD